MEYSAVIVAAGSGTRTGLGYNKVYYRFSGKTVLEMTMGVFMADPDCTELVIVTDAREYMENIPGRVPGKIVFAKGGATRQESVRNGLQAVTADVVLIHDGARPYLPGECLEAVKKAMETEEAACLCVPCKDTVKEAENGYIVSTPERSRLYLAQTPQAFRTEVILRCMRKAEAEGFTGTDDASLAERYGHRVRIVNGSYANIKITTPEDLKG